jgi:outer membrane receptor for ferrienterochelin and colicin
MIALKGQVSVTGTIIDGASGEALAGVAVIARDANTVAVSHIDGSFNIALPQGEHTIEIAHIGYLGKSLKVSSSTELGSIKLDADALELEQVLVIASFAKDRETPVALSTIKPELIAEKLGHKEFPEILRTTPSVYVTKLGGGYGDSRIALRGFDSNNIGILINGVPVNDMENGKVYWSNWAGLADVTRTMQVQRGLGASKLALSSVGGTVNIITRNTDAEQGGSVYTGFGNDGYRKYSFTLSTGLLSNGWAMTVSGATSASDGYVRGTDYRAYSYFVNISKVLSDKHRLSFQAFGAPQWHNQRGNMHKISTYNNTNPDIPFTIKDGKKFNSDFGYREGKAYGGAYGYNVYHKPQISLNHYWTIDNTSSLSTAVYASIASGGGRRIAGTNSSLLGWNTRDDKPNAYVTDEGLVDFDRAIADNVSAANAARGSQIIVANSINEHQWFGLLSSYNKTFGDNLKLTAGVDARYYNGAHANEIVDLLGGKCYYDSSTNNVNRAKNVPLQPGDKYSYHNEDAVLWLGLFSQLEYTADSYSAFISASASSQNYQRKDYFLYTPGNQVSDWKGFLPFSVKAGFNYNINDNHNLFVNGGYFTRSPYFDFVYFNYTNDPDPNVKMEKIISGEAGYGFTSRLFKANLGFYYTNWRDRGVRKTVGNTYSQILGINALHKGVELEMQYNPAPGLFIIGMWSLGDWVWQNDVHFTLYDDNQSSLGSYDAYLKGVHVGNAAQHTLALGLDYEVFKSVKIGADLNYFGKNFAEFDPSTRTTAGVYTDSWQLPDATIVNVNLRWNFKIGGLNATLYGNVDNLFNEEYFSDASDGANHDSETAKVYYGFGRTWVTGLRINF